MKAIRFKDPEDLSVQFSCRDADSERYPAVLVAAFVADIPDGSAGKAWGVAITRHTLAALATFQPLALVLDFRGLSYRWGDSLLGVYQAVEEYLGEPGGEFPIVTVVSDLSSGLRSLLAGDLAVFEDFERALRAAGDLADSEE